MAVALNWTKADIGDPTRKLILIGFANHAAKDGTNARPKVKTVADYACCSDRTARRHIGTLLADGFLREGDQSQVAHMPHHLRPVVYDVAMSEAQRAEWATAYAQRQGTTARAMRAGAAVDANDPDAVPPVSLSGGRETPPPVSLSGGQEALPPVTHDRGSPDTGDRGPLSPMTGLNHKRNLPTEPSKDFHVEPDGPTALIEVDPASESDPIQAHKAETLAAAQRLCDHLAQRMIANGCKQPTISKAWLDSARLLMERDGCTEQQIHAVIDWCQGNDFWRANILSMPKLRQKYDQLRLQAARETNPIGFRPRVQSYSDDVWDEPDQSAGGFL